MHNKKVHMVAFVLLIAGGLNWLLYAIAGTDLGGMVLGGMDSAASTVLYILVGLAAVYELISHKKSCCHCEKGHTCSVAAPSAASADTPEESA